VDLCAALCRGREHPGLELRLRYSEARILPSVSYRNAFVEVSLNPGRKVVVERHPVGEEMTVSVAQWPQLEEEMSLHGAAAAGAGTALQLELRRFERITSGLQDYY